MSAGPERNLKIIIAGAGVGGAAAARALRSAGFEVKVLERATDRRATDTGQAFDIWVNAARALRDLGVNDQVEAIGVERQRQIFRSPSGTELGGWPLTEYAKQFGLKHVSVQRGDLVRILRQAAGEDIVEMDSQVVGYQEEENGVTAQLANSHEERGDILVGADGGKSVVRKQIHGEDPLKYAGYAVWRGHILSGHPQVPTDVSQIFLGRGYRFAFYPFGPDRVNWFSVATSPQGDTTVDKAALLERHRGWMTPIEEVIEATDESTITRTELYYRDPISDWGTGRVTLIGDAAHAMTNDLAQGACQSLEDAVVLARCLSEEADPVAALRTYERRRAPRTSDIVNRSLALGRRLTDPNPIKYAVRNPFVKVIGHRGLLRQYERDMTYQY
jgi:2-polyprenyl-6-methoxyphenol hydroxylase-like FAD-dependent oxidoreductase